MTPAITRHTVVNASGGAHDQEVMLERFTDRARRIIVLAQEEARLLKHNYLGTEHLLLGLIRDGRGTAAKALDNVGISLEAARGEVGEIIGQGQQVPRGHIPFTPRAKKVLELSDREARKHGDRHIGTGHLLLAVIREGEGVAVQALVGLGVDLPELRQRVVLELSADAGDDERISTAEHGEEADSGELPDEAVMAQAEFTLSALSDQLAEIRARLRDIAERVERIERHVSEGDDSP